MCAFSLLERLPALMFSLASELADFPPFTCHNAGHPPELVWLSRQNIVELVT